MAKVRRVLDHQNRLVDQVQTNCLPIWIWRQRIEEVGLDDDIRQAVVADFAATGTANAKTFEKLSTTVSQ